MRVVLSPPELESVADLLHDSEHRVVSVKRQALSSLDSIEAVPAGAFGTAAGEIQQAVNILDQVTGTGAGGLHNLVATLFHDEMFVRRCRDEALLDLGAAPAPTGVGQEGSHRPPRPESAARAGPRRNGRRLSAWNCP